RSRNVRRALQHGRDPDAPRRVRAGEIPFRGRSACETGRRGREDHPAPPPSGTLNGTSEAARAFTADSGLIPHIPEGTDRCWAAPCTPYPSPALRLRREGDMGGGFILVSSSAPPTAPLKPIHLRSLARFRYCPLGLMTSF